MISHATFLQAIDLLILEEKKIPKFTEDILLATYTSGNTDYDLDYLFVCVTSGASL